MDLNIVYSDRAFCSFTLLSDGVMVVEDATKDVRFSDNPFVTGDAFIQFYAGIRFYAGARIGIAGGHWIGALCLIDGRPRSFTAAARDRLAAIAREIAASLDPVIQNEQRPAPVSLHHARPNWSGNLKPIIVTARRSVLIGLRHPLRRTHARIASQRPGAQMLPARGLLLC